MITIKLEIAKLPLIISILMQVVFVMLVAMIGAIVLTFRQRSGIKRQSYFKQISREKAEGVQLIDVEKKKGVKIDV